MFNHALELNLFPGFSNHQRYRIFWLLLLRLFRNSKKELSARQLAKVKLYRQTSLPPECVVRITKKKGDVYFLRLYRDETDSARCGWQPGRRWCFSSARNKGDKPISPLQLAYFGREDWGGLVTGHYVVRDHSPDGNGRSAEVRSRNVFSHLHYGFEFN